MLASVTSTNLPLLCHEGVQPQVAVPQGCTPHSIIFLSCASVLQQTHNWVALCQKARDTTERWQTLPGMWQVSNFYHVIKYSLMTYIMSLHPQCIRFFYNKYQQISLLFMILSQHYKCLDKCVYFYIWYLTNMCLLQSLSPTPIGKGTVERNFFHLLRVMNQWEHAWTFQQVEWSIIRDIFNFVSW